MVSEQDLQEIEQIYIANIKLLAEIDPNSVFFPTQQIKVEAIGRAVNTLRNIW